MIGIADRVFLVIADRVFLVMQKVCEHHHVVACLSAVTQARLYQCQDCRLIMPERAYHRVARARLGTLHRQELAHVRADFGWHSMEARAVLEQQRSEMLALNDL